MFDSLNNAHTPQGTRQLERKRNRSGDVIGGGKSLSSTGDEGGPNAACAVCAAFFIVIEKFLEWLEK
ncbi:hypothetical protein MtrunA17_Chr4g0063921 [Medicago truncatula]|nr:hypothetical protein MtrunA17_Chr4g0063921 [Medicago truncatula]